MLEERIGALEQARPERLGRSQREPARRLARRVRERRRRPAARRPADGASARSPARSGASKNSSASATTRTARRIASTTASPRSTTRTSRRRSRRQITFHVARPSEAAAVRAPLALAACASVAGHDRAAATRRTRRRSRSRPTARRSTSSTPTPTRSSSSTSPARTLVTRDHARRAHPAVGRVAATFTPRVMPRALALSPDGDDALRRPASARATLLRDRRRDAGDVRRLRSWQRAGRPRRVAATARRSSSRARRTTRSCASRARR